MGCYHYTIAASCSLRRISLRTFKYIFIISYSKKKVKLTRREIYGFEPFQKIFAEFFFNHLCFAEPSLHFSSRIRTLADGVRARCLTAWRRRMVSVEGFEPPNGGVRVRCLTHLAKPKFCQDTYHSKVERYSCCLCLYYNNYITFFFKSQIIKFFRLAIFEGIHNSKIPLQES